jgi:hypothetical protein
VEAAAGDDANPPPAPPLGESGDDNDSFVFDSVRCGRPLYAFAVVALAGAAAGLVVVVVLENKDDRLSRDENNGGAVAVVVVDRVEVADAAPPAAEKVLPLLFSCCWPLFASRR